MDGGAALHTAWVKDVFIFLGAAGIVVPIFHRARIGAVFGFLVVGLIVGPFGLGRLEWDYPWVDYLTIDDPERVEPFAELGVIFLLFLLGLELSFERLWQMRRYLLGVGAVQVAMSALAIGAVAATLGAGVEVSIVLGLCLALSSTAIVMQLLRDEKRVATPAGRLAFAVLLFQDLMVVPILFITGIFGGDGKEGILLPLLIAFGQAALAIIVIMVAGRLVLRPLFRFVAGTGSRDLIMAVTVLIVVTAAGGTAVAGLSSALGAFLAGLLLGETEHRHEIDVDLEPFKGLLLGLFFVTVGMTIDLTAVAAQVHLLVLAVLGLLLLKAAIMFAAARLLGVPATTAIESAVLLSQAGEFALVIITLARGDGLMDGSVAQFATSVVGITMILTPLLAMAARRTARLFGTEQADTLPPNARDLEADAILIGFGRIGKLVAEALENEGIVYVATDTDADMVARARKTGRPVYFGDGQRVEILERMGAERAKVVIAALSEGDAAARIAQQCARHWPHLSVVARAKDMKHAAVLLQAGAIVVPEALEPGLQLAGRVLDALGYPDEKVSDSLASLRARVLSGVSEPSRTKRGPGNAGQRGRTS